jgi:transcription initiation factor TFIIIB Brf1 subunit/transcription initiation factor TFIIB
MTTHYDCGGELIENQKQEYVCQQCGATIRASVVSRQAHFERVAESDGPLQEIAKAALEGVK